MADPLHCSHLENPSDSGARGCNPWGHKGSDWLEVTERADIVVYNIALLSAGQRSEPVTSIHISHPVWTSLPHRIPPGLHVRALAAQRFTAQV